MAKQSVINDDMVKMAAYAAKTAQERFNCILDYSEGSIERLETLLEQAYQYFKQQTANEGRLNTDSVQHTANVWGSYLGELIRQRQGGNWIERDNEKILLIDKREFQPITYVYQRITSQPQYSAMTYYAQVSSNTNGSVQGRQSVQPDRIPIFNEPPTQMQQMISSSTNSGVKKRNRRPLVLVLIGLIILGIAAFVFVIINNSNAISQEPQNAIPQEFRINMTAFLKEGDKLSIMTEQGVNVQDYGNQLVEVKTAYVAVNGAWPTSLTSEKNAFDKALRGWNLVLDIWKKKIDGTDYLHWFDSLYENADSYASGLNALTFSGDFGNTVKIDDAIGFVMAKASDSFSNGELSINDKLKQ